MKPYALSELCFTTALRALTALQRALQRLYSLQCLTNMWYDMLLAASDTRESSLMLLTCSHVSHSVSTGPAVYYT
jgi:hypothetical protein